MNKLKPWLGLMSAVLLLSSCAASYKSINPSTVSYVANTNDGELELHYRHAVMGELDNKRYSKKEESKDIRVVAVNIINQSDSDINFEDISFFSGNKQLTRLDKETIHRELKQIVPSYLLYLLLTPLKLSTTNSEGAINETPIGFGLGPSLALINVLGAATANGKLKKDLQRYDLSNKVIKKGESVYGLVGFRDSTYDPLTIRHKQLKISSPS